MHRRLYDLQHLSDMSNRQRYLYIPSTWVPDLVSHVVAHIPFSLWPCSIRSIVLLTCVETLVKTSKSDGMTFVIYHIEIFCPARQVRKVLELHLARSDFRQDGVPKTWARIVCSARRRQLVWHATEGAATYL